ncbi:MAG: hypothetical protein K0S71_516 [Clostridia bacterium]|jgi:hypothetical protein|nr:hypothetical protein [Clostridia bacterium]
MFIFIDVTQLTKQMKSIPGICMVCQQKRQLILLKTYSCFRIFFIPIWHWGERYYITDQTCGAVYEISEEDAVLVKYDKKDISTCMPIAEHQTVIKCTACGKVLEQEYEFCPYCGYKRK